MKTKLKQLTDQEFKIIKYHRDDLVENGKDFYIITSLNMDNRIITNISYIKNPYGWLEYIEVWPIEERVKENDRNNLAQFS